MKRHAELCQQILKTIIYDLIPSSPLFEQKASKSWELITRLLLGITDNLLWSDKQNYLADDLSEILLNSLFFVLLQSRIYCDEIWKKFASCFKSWCHRLKSVLVWGSVTVALNSKIASILYNPNLSDTHEIIFGMHFHEYRVIIEVKYANYCWSRLTSNSQIYLVLNLIFIDLLPKITDLSGDIFLRALQSYEKIINTWLSAGETTSEMSVCSDPKIDRKLPNANTLFDIYGESLFEACMIEKSSHDQGRAIAISIICKIISKWQYRENISDNYLSISCSCLRSALSGDILASATALYHMEPVLVSGHLGILSLVIPVFAAVLRFVPKSKTVKSPLQTVPLENLRMCCYRLLSLIYCYFDEHDGPLSSKITADLNVHNFKMPESATSQTSPTFACFGSALKNPTTFLKATHLDTILASLLIEDCPSNMRFLLNSISTVLFTDHQNFPDLFTFLVRKFEELLLKPPTNWAASLVVTQISIVRILEQWSRLNVLPSADSTRLCTSLIGLTVSLYSKLNLPLYFRLIISIYETVFSWLSVSGSPFICVSAFINALVKFMNQDAKALNNANANNPNNSKNSISNPLSPSVYGIKTHKSLAERVFTLELGHDDPRPSSLSPTLLKGVDEIFLEYTDSTLQRLIGLLLQEQINSNYPVEMNSTISDLDLLASGQVVKYYTLSSSIVIGFTDKIMFVRNSIGKFTWAHEYSVTRNAVQVSRIKEESSLVLDLEPVDSSLLKPFNRKYVVTESSELDISVVSDVSDDELILNESDWVRTLENNKSVAAKITPILNEVDKHINEEISPFIPLKSRVNRVHPQAALPLDTPEILSRLLFTHFGFLSSSTQALVGILTPSESFLDDLKKLDELSSRETLTIPIYFVGTRPQTCLDCDCEIDCEGDCEGQNSESAVSKSFEAFVTGLGGYDHTGIGPIYADTSFQVAFPVIADTAETRHYNESVSVIWSEDSETLQSLPPSPSNFVHLLISPILIGGEKGKFFRIRILLARSLQAEYNSIQSLYNVSPRGLFNMYINILLVFVSAHFTVVRPSAGWNGRKEISFESNHP